MPDDNYVPTDEHGGFATEQRDPLIRVLHTVIQYAVRALAICRPCTRSDLLADSQEGPVRVIHE